MTLTRSDVARKPDKHFDFLVQENAEGVLATLYFDIERDIVACLPGESREASVEGATARIR
jgi:hypothetical protein